MNDNTIAYMICESEISPIESTRLLQSDFNGKTVAEGILQTANEKNRNGRWYDREELIRGIQSPRIIELMEKGYLRAELGHPLSKDLQRQSNIDDKITCARFLKIWTQGNDIWGQFVGTNNEYGRAFDMDLKEGCLPAWSLRALGSIKQTRNGAEVHNLRIITWDQVIYPSHPGAYTQRVIGESVNQMESVLAESGMIGNENQKSINENGFVFPITNADVIKSIEQDSNNLKFVKECFDFVYDHINVTEDGSKVILYTNSLETIVVNLESFVHRELMDYATNQMMMEG